jgi:hypothetical protein
MVSVAALSLFLAGAAGAQEEVKKTAAVGQENFGFGAGVGFFNPNGLVLRGGARAVSLEVSGGFGITLLSYGSNTDPKLKLLAPLEVSPQMVFDFLEFRREVRAGLRAGYRYNAALGSGGTVGGQIGKRWGHLLLEGLGGISVYPEAAAKLRGEEVSQGTDFNFPPEFNYGVTVQVLYYP